ncbi:dihydrofolate reductase family protein [Terriglobus tenax]|uniref:dihydrofolate reductase family protein n=1 Tax=Terriglobus tenax TaxID=1111115 RepID=UPI0021E0CC63|nr:dihydrofolate reductase family protein [Terriglobus tenax]
MARIRGYIASSLDDYIADQDGSLDWLFKYDGMDLGEHDYRLFAESIRTVVMGRDTYDFIAAQPAPWAYEGKRVIVVTSRPISSPAGELETRDNVEALIDELRALNDGDVWMLGGGRLQSAFLQRGALDDIEIYVMPEIIGGGTPLFPSTGLCLSPKLAEAKPLDKGCVYMRYVFS